MRKLSQKRCKIAIIISVICSILFFSCEKNEVGTQNNNESLSLKNKNELISESLALDIATKFNPSIFFNQNNPTNYSKKVSPLNGNNKIKNKFIINDSNKVPAFYIFNYENNQGFVFVSADLKMQPILAFIENGEFKKDLVPAGLLQWVDRTIESIEILRKGQYDNSKDANYAWNNFTTQNLNRNNNYLKNNSTSRLIDPPINPCDKPDTSYTVGPLLNVTWGQNCSYNELCPSLSCNLGCGNGYAYTGCVATATAQVVRYWHPTNKYNYNYNAMPTNYGNTEVERLMKDIGLSENVNMDYGCTGSSADGGNVANALKANFGFSSANNAEYDYQRVKNNINVQQPVLLKGCNTSTGHYFIINWYNSYSDCHQWVCDGSSTYNYTICENGQWVGGGSYLYFHMNWGWHEYGSSNDYIGWFGYNNWEISGVNFNFHYSNGLTSEIHT